ncbi:MAG TPA: acyltransferase [Puia sp.]
MKYLKSFDGLRAISILFVVFTHAGINRLLPQGYFFQERIWLLFAGGTGVNIFFALSGFLITRILLSELAKTGSLSLRHFYIRRALRLLPPLLILYAIIGALMLTHQVQGTATAFWFSFFYIYNFLPPGLNMGELAHTWSLAVEEQFYLTWPLILLFFKPRRAFYIGVDLVVLCVIARLFLWEINIMSDGHPTPITELYRTEVWFIPAVAPIILGALGAIVLIDNKKLEDTLRSYHRFFLLVAAVLFASPLYFASYISELNYIVQSLGVVLLLALLMLREDTRVSKILGIRPLVYIGRISYGIYVYQGLAVHFGPAGQIPAIAIAILSYHFVETPILRLKEKFR